MRSFKKIIKISDIIFTGVIIAVAVSLLFAFVQSGDKVVISRYGEEIASFPLYEDNIFDAGTNIISIKDGKVFVSHADCENQVCKKTGSISKANQTIVCAPNGITVSITGEGDIDAYTR